MQLQIINVFGSFARGEDTSKSDADVAVVTNKNKRLDLKRYEAKLGRRLNLYEIRLKECSREFLNNLANGIVLYGYLRLVE